MRPRTSLLYKIKILVIQFAVPYVREFDSVEETQESTAWLEGYSRSLVLVSGIEWYTAVNMEVPFSH